MTDQLEERAKSLSKGDSVPSLQKEYYVVAVCANLRRSTVISVAEVWEAGIKNTHVTFRPFSGGNNGQAPCLRVSLIYLNDACSRKYEFDLGCMYARKCFQICLSLLRSNNPHPTPVDLSSSWSLPSSVCALDPPSAMHSANLLGQNLILVRVREAPNFGGEPGSSFHRRARCSSTATLAVRSVTLCFPCAVALRGALSAYKLCL
jgi:hypothetical protein